VVVHAVEQNRKAIEFLDSVGENQPFDCFQPTGRGFLLGECGFEQLAEEGVFCEDHEGQLGADEEFGTVFYVGVGVYR
jgi:hypothetical protein